MTTTNTTVPTGEELTAAADRLATVLTATVRVMLIAMAVQMHTAAVDRSVVLLMVTVTVLVLLMAAVVRAHLAAVESWADTETPVAVLMPVVVVEEVLET